MPVVQYTVRSISDLLRVLPRVYGTPRKTVWFRGQENEAWKLLPSLVRPPDRSNNEMVYVKRFKQHASPFLDQVPSHEWEWLFLMQHYEVPTRLLDWSESALVGLWFALAEPKRKADRNKRGAVWCLYPNELNRISKLDMKPPHDIPCFGDDEVLNKYLPSRVIGVTTADFNPVAIVAPRHTDTSILHASFSTSCTSEGPKIRRKFASTHLYRSSKKNDLRLKANNWKRIVRRCCRLWGRSS